MSTQITTGYVKSFRETVMMLAQQTMSKLRPYVRVEDQMSEIQFYDQVGLTYMVEKQQQAGGRHSVSPQMNTPHARRAVKKGDYIIGDFIDRIDQVNTLNDFRNPYVRAFAAAAGRQTDYILLNGSADAAVGGGVFGSCLTDKEGATPITWAAFVGANPDHQILHGGVGMTLDKWITAKSVLDGASLVDTGGYVIVLTEKQVRELLADPQLTSADYNTVKALVTGEVNSFLGMDVVMISSGALATNNLVAPATTASIVPAVVGPPAYRRCVAFSKNHLLLTLGIDSEANVAKRADVNFSWYAHLALSLGATRLEEKGFVEIQCAE